MQYDHQGYVLRISRYAQWLVTTSSGEEIKEAIAERLANSDEAEAKDLRDACARFWRQKQLTGRVG